MKYILLFYIILNYSNSCNNYSVNNLNNKIIGKWQCYKFTMGGSEYNPKGAKYYNDFYWQFNKDTFIDSTVFISYSYSIIDSILYINNKPKCDIIELNDSVLIVHKIEKYFKEAEYQKLYYFKKVENYTFPVPKKH